MSDFIPPSINLDLSKWEERHKDATLLLNRLNKPEGITLLRHEFLEKWPGKVEVLIGEAEWYVRYIPENTGFDSIIEFYNQVLQRLRKQKEGMVFLIAQSIAHGKLGSSHLNFAKLLVERLSLTIEAFLIQMHNRRIENIISPESGVISLWAPPTLVHDHEQRLKNIDEIIEALKTVPFVADTRSIENEEKYQDKTGQRKRRSRIDREELYPRIVEDAKSLYEAGIFIAADVFKQLSKESIERYGQEFSPGQLRGIFQREKGTFKPRPIR